VEVAMKKWVAIGVCLFPIALGVVAGLRLSKESLAVVMGVLFGLVASLPLYLVTFLVLKKEARREAQPQQPLQQYPPIIVISSDSARYLPPSVPLGPEQRKIVKVIGDD
jgi:hypothetical protein